MKGKKKLKNINVLKKKKIYTNIYIYIYINIITHVMHESRGEIHGLSGAEAQNKPHFVDVIVLLSFKCSMFLFS